MSGKHTHMHIHRQIYTFRNDDDWSSMSSVVVHLFYWLLESSMPCSIAFFCNMSWEFVLKSITIRHGSHANIRIRPSGTEMIDGHSANHTFFRCIPSFFFSNPYLYVGVSCDGSFTWNHIWIRLSGHNHSWKHITLHATLTSISRHLVKYCCRFLIDRL